MPNALMSDSIGLTENDRKTDNGDLAVRMHIASRRIVFVSYLQTCSESV